MEVCKRDGQMEIWLDNTSWYNTCGDLSSNKDSGDAWLLRPCNGKSWGGGGTATYDGSAPSQTIKLHFEK